MLVRATSLAAILCFCCPVTAELVDLNQEPATASSAQATARAFEADENMDQAGPGPGNVFSGCGVLSQGPQGCIFFTPDGGPSYALSNSGGFGPGTRVWVVGTIIPSSVFCAPFMVPGILVQEVGRCFEDCGVLQSGPQGCFVLQSGGQSYLIENTGGFGTGDEVWVQGCLNPNSTICPPVIGPGIESNTIGRCFAGCGVLQAGPQGCTILITDNAFYFIENTGPFNLGDRVWVKGCLNPNSTLCPPFTAPGIEDNTIGLCFEGCGRLIPGPNCTLFQADAGGVYVLDNLGGFNPGDRVFVTGCLNPNCVTICGAPDGCIEDNLISPCPLCEPAPAGDACSNTPCPATDQQCLPVCVRIGPLPDQIRIIACKCLRPHECHVIFTPQQSASCAGQCPVGTICSEKYVEDPDGSVTLCCDCRPLGCTCGGDVNNDGVINGLDIDDFVRCVLQPAIGTPDNRCRCADVNGNNVIDENDLNEFVVLLLTKSQCPPRGGCCLDVDDGPVLYDTCFETDQLTCEVAGGVWQGPDSACNIQACCLPNSTCVNIDPQCCLASGGTPFGPGVLCIPGSTCTP